MSPTAILLTLKSSSFGDVATKAGFCKVSLSFGSANPNDHVTIEDSS